MVKYPAGSGGMIILHCFSTAKNVVDWHVKIDPIDFVNKNFPLKNGILPIELDKPYNLSWFTKQLPFTRGLSLSKEEAYNEAVKEKIVRDAIKNNFYIPFRYTRIDNPTWFNGKSFSISPDNDTKTWLLKRRKMLFYKIENDLVIDLKFHSSNPNKKYHSHTQYNDDPPVFYKGKLDTIAEKDFYKNKCDQPHTGDCNIKISDVLDLKKHKKIFKEMEDLIQEPLDRNWCEPALKRWTKIWCNI